MRRGLEGSTVFDAGVLIELLSQTPSGAWVRDRLLEGRLIAYTTELAIAEIKYVLCRRIGWDAATRAIDLLLASRYITIEPITLLIDYAAQYKCKYPIALPDCFTLALAKRLESPALFARKERELAHLVKQKALDVEILFLETLVPVQKP